MFSPDFRFMLLKSVAAGFLVVFISIHSFGQHSFIKNAGDSLAPDSRVASIVNGFHLSDEDLTKFLEIYQAYLKDQKQVFKCSFLTLGNLARAAAGIPEKDALECLNTQLVNLHDEIGLKEQYFNRIATEVDAFAALRFLQTETYFSLALQSAASYTDPASKAFVYARASAIPVPDIVERKYLDFGERYRADVLKMMSAEENLPVRFFQNTSNLTPEACRQLGQDYIALQRREAGLMTKYFREIDLTLGTRFAACFVAFQGHQSAKIRLEAAQKTLNHD